VWKILNQAGVDPAPRQPGWALFPGARAARPSGARVYVSHGTVDRVLPIDRCSRQLVPRLRALGYDVTYDEFDGGHDVPDSIVRRAMDWWRCIA
jgi:predicted esterase